MTDERISIPQLSDDEQAALDRMWNELRQRTPRNVLRSSYYDGKHAVRQVGTVIPPQYYRLAITLGWSGKAVDLLARRVNLTGFTHGGVDLDAVGSGALWDANHEGSEVSQAITSGLIHGVSFLVTSAGRDGEPDGLVHALDALSATGVWDRRQRRLSSALEIGAWGEDGRPSSLTVHFPGLVVRCRRDAVKWDVERTAHPYGMPVEPLVHRPRTGREMGSSRITRPIMSLHDSALRTLIRMEGHQDIYSIPQLILLGADASVLENADGSPKPAWQVALGRVFALPDDHEREGALARAEVKQFNAQSPEAHLASLNAYAKMFAREASLPDTAVAITDIANPTSAEAYDSSQYELIAEAEGVQDEFSRPLVRTHARLLAMAHGDPSLLDALEGLRPQWRNPRYLTRAAEADAGLKQLQAAPWLAETSVGLELLGLSPAQIERANAERRRSRGAAVLQRLAPPSPVSDDDDL